MSKSVYKTVGCRKARVGPNPLGDLDIEGHQWSVFKHTLYLGHWFYDGYSAHATQAEAEAAMEEWLKRGQL